MRTVVLVVVVCVAMGASAELWSSVHATSRSSSHSKASVRHHRHHPRRTGTIQFKGSCRVSALPCARACVCVCVCVCVCALCAAIDRLDYSEFFNYDADDNISWVPYSGDMPKMGSNRSFTSWGKARALRLSYRHTFNRLHEALHTAQPAGKKRMILNNCNTVCRLDQMRSFDGTFSEGAALNSCVCPLPSPPMPASHCDLLRCTLQCLQCNACTQSCVDGLAQPDYPLDLLARVRYQRAQQLLPAASPHECLSDGEETPFCAIICL